MSVFLAMLRDVFSSLNSFLSFFFFFLSCFILHSSTLSSQLSLSYMVIAFPKFLRLCCSHHDAILFQKQRENPTNLGFKKRLWNTGKQKQQLQNNATTNSSPPLPVCFTAASFSTALLAGARAGPPSTEDPDRIKPINDPFVSSPPATTKENALFIDNLSPLSFCDLPIL